MTKLVPIDYTSNNAKEEYIQSLIECGFAVLKNHTIDQQLIADVFEEWASFYASEYKYEYLYRNDTQDGFYPITVSEKAVGYDIKDIKEFFHYYPWGLIPKELSNKTNELRAQMDDIGFTLLQWTEEGLPQEIKNKLSQPLSTMIGNSEKNLMRILHYPPLTGNEEQGAVRASPHGDINLITLLVAASQSGLQLKNKEGNWLDVPVDPGMLAINIGDMLEEATNGFYKSTIHRVINPIGDERFKSRYSIPYFLHATEDVIISDKYTAKSFLHQRQKEIGIRK